MTRHLHIAATLLAVAALGACGATGPGTLEDAPQPTIAPLKGVDNATLVEKVDIAEGDTQRLQSAATNETRTGLAEFRDAKITLGNGPDPGIIVRFDMNGNGRFNDDGVDQYFRQIVTPDAQVIDFEDGEPLNTAGKITVGGQVVAFNRSGVVEEGDREMVVYVPRDTAQKMYAGLFTNQSLGGSGSFATFGRRTTEAELDEQRRLGGSATYSGIAVASVEHFDQDRDKSGTVTGISNGGTYRGTANGAIDFGTNQATVTARMENVEPGRTGTVDMNVNGQIARDGSIDGPATFTGLDVNGQQTVGGFEGHAYGPNAESVAGTFTGNIPKDVTTQEGSTIAGGVLMNQTGRNMNR